MLNYFSFVRNCYKTGLIKTLADRMYRINNSWASFDIDLKDLFYKFFSNLLFYRIIDTLLR